MKRFLLLMLPLLMLASCNGGGKPQQAGDSMYADSSLWYQTGKLIDPSLPDVFYVLPTCVFDWTDSLNVTHHHADPFNHKHRRRMESSYRLADEIFADSANLFAPYYRQITFDSWLLNEDTINSRYKLAFSDLEKAFGYFIKNLNHGRPFILAGFSQGGKGVVELVKAMPDDVYKRMIAAYAIGYKVTEADLAVSDKLEPAQSDSDTGVTISYNTVTDTSAICDLVNKDTRFIINPCSWTIDTLWHSLNDSVSLRLDLDKNVIVAKGLTASLYYEESLDILFKEGNLHLQELNLYKAELQKNVKTRIRSFTTGR